MNKKTFHILLKVDKKNLKTIFHNDNEVNILIEKTV